MLSRLFGALCLAAASFAAPAAQATTAQLISVDFGSSDDGFRDRVALFQGPESQAEAASPLFADADVWNAVDLALTFNAPDAVFDDLRDSTGASTGVGLELSGAAQAFEASSDVDGDPAKPLFGSYLFVGGNPVRPPSADFKITGLAAGGRYALYFYGAVGNDGTHEGTVTLDEGGDGDLAGDAARALSNAPGNGVGATNLFFDLVTAGDAGDILGRFARNAAAPDGRSPELNVAGFQIARVQPVPLPAGAALLPAALLLAAGLRLRR